MKLTRRQRDVLQVLSDYIDKHGYSPTVRDIADITGHRSTSTVHGLLDRLEQNGYISREPSSPRTIRVLRRAV